ncbi:MAG: hypothetical protein ACNA8K_14040 [Cyclonatronaceae bacterium]
MNTKSKLSGQEVIRAFSKKSGSYTSWAEFQKEAAGRLSGWLPDKLPGQILETGAGTGLFTRYLIRKYPDIPILVTDASKEMLIACRHELGRLFPDLISNGFDINTQMARSITLSPGIADCDTVAAYTGSSADKSSKRDLRFFVYNPEKEGPHTLKHHLVVSALTAQWFSDFKKGIAALANSVSDRGQIIFSYLTNSSFPEWSNKCSELGIPYTANRLPDAESGSNVLRSMGFDVKSKNISITIGYASAIDFFRSLKMTGASTQLGGISNRPSDMKRLISAIELTDNRVSRTEKVFITYNLDIVTGFR